MAFNVNALGFGDNVVDRYEHIHTMYPGGNAVNFAVYAKKCGAARSAYMGILAMTPLPSMSLQASRMRVSSLISASR